MMVSHSYDFTYIPRFVFHLLIQGKKRFDVKKIRIHIQHTKIHTHNDVIQVFSMKNTMFEFEKMLRSIYLVLWTNKMGRHRKESKVELRPSGKNIDLENFEH